jgi:hypothetical protein
VLRFKVVGIGGRPMLIERRTDLLIPRSRRLLILLLIVHLEPSVTQEASFGGTGVFLIKPLVFVLVGFAGRSPAFAKRISTSYTDRRGELFNCEQELDRSRTTELEQPALPINSKKKFAN